MSEEFIKDMKDLLLAQRAELIQKMEAEKERFKDEATAESGKDSIDVANDEGAFKKMEALNAMDAKRLMGIENALKRISENRYGKCLMCGKPIPEARLRAIPSAVLCIDCKSKDEKRRFAK